MMMEMNEQYVIVELDEEELEEVAGGRHVQSTGNGVHIRKGPGTGYTIIGKVNKGDASPTMARARRTARASAGIA